MATSYQVNITMPGDTVTALLDNNFSLYGFQVVKSSTSGGTPVVWFQTIDFALTTTISWEAQFHAYTSRRQVVANTHIDAEASYPADLGQVLTVKNAMGIGEVSKATTVQDIPNGISILNTTSTQFTCGLEQQQPNGGFSPICAFPLFGNNMNLIVPIEQIYLMFSSYPMNTGYVIEQAYGPGILIDLTGASTRTVSYDINGGWSWHEEEAWALTLLPNQTLAPLLIQPMSLAAPR